MIKPSKLFIWLVIIWSSSLQAHEARPIFIQIDETTQLQYIVQLRVPLTVPEINIPQLKLPNDCQIITLISRHRVAQAYSLKQQYRCSSPLSGQLVELNFPVNTLPITSLFKLTLLSGVQYSQLLNPGEFFWQIPVQESRWDVAQQYAQLGVKHIWTGIDHLLFIACLIFIAGNRRRIFLTLTGFTLAHSLTLMLSTLQWFCLPIPPVEAAIALSILLLAHEMSLNNANSWTYRYPVLVSSCFGLLHGFGFATVLTEIGLPQTEIATALLLFNLGVEIGQCLFVIALLSIGMMLRKTIFTLAGISNKQIRFWSSYLIGTTAAFWLLQRLTVLTS